MKNVVDAAEKDPAGALNSFLSERKAYIDEAQRKIRWLTLFKNESVWNVSLCDSMVNVHIDRYRSRRAGRSFRTMEAYMHYASYFAQHAGEAHNNIEVFEGRMHEAANRRIPQDLCDAFRLVDTYGLYPTKRAEDGLVTVVDFYDEDKVIDKVPKLFGSVEPIASSRTLEVANWSSSLSPLARFTAEEEAVRVRLVDDDLNPLVRLKHFGGTMLGGWLAEVRER